MEIWGELSLPSDPLALSDSNLFECIDDSEHDQYEDDPDLDEQRLHAYDLNSYVCNAAKALESVLSEALGKYPLVLLDEQTKSKGAMKSNQKLARKTSGKCRSTISTSLFGDSLESYDDTHDLLEIWDETELDEEISSIEEEIERIQQQKYEIESTVPYSPRIESHENNTLSLKSTVVSFWKILKILLTTAIALLHYLHHFHLHYLLQLHLCLHCFLPVHYRMNKMTTTMIHFRWISLLLKKIKQQHVLQIVFLLLRQRTL